MKGRTRRFASLTLSLLLATSTFSAFPAAAENAGTAADAAVQQEFYVAVNGSDSNSGSKESPFATIERARQAVDEVNDDMTGDIIVNIGAGDYYLEDTVTFGPEDSGTNGYKVIYRSADGVGKANLIGGEPDHRLGAVEQEDVDTYDLDASLLGKVYKVQLDPEKYDFNTLYVNDQRATMARTKNRENHPNFPMAKGEYMQLHRRRQRQSEHVF